MEEERLGGIASAYEKRWGQLTLALAEEMISEYWSDPRQTQRDVISAFYAKFKEESIRHERCEAPPSKETLRVWIQASSNYFKLRSRFGEAVARASLQRTTSRR